MKEYIAESSQKAKKSRKDFQLFRRISVQVTHALPENIDLELVLKEIESKIPKNLIQDLETIYIGEYEPLINRQIDSMYTNGTILVTNNQPSNKELFGTFIHEFAHCIEEKEKELIYSDGTLAREFLSKRKTLFDLLKDDYEISKKDFLDINFNEKFDNFAYKTVGYDNLGVITNGLFVSPYACTSLREYFANGFEHYFLRDLEELKERCPVLLKKIKRLLRTN